MIAIDPEGPAARTTLRVGDFIVDEVSAWLSPGGSQEGLVTRRDEVGWFFR